MSWSSILLAEVARRLALLLCWSVMSWSKERTLSLIYMRPHKLDTYSVEKRPKVSEERASPKSFEVFCSDSAILFSCSKWVFSSFSSSSSSSLSLSLTNNNGQISNKMSDNGTPSLHSGQAKRRDRKWNQTLRRIVGKRRFQCGRLGWHLGEARASSHRLKSNYTFL